MVDLSIVTFNYQRVRWKCWKVGSKDHQRSTPLGSPARKSCSNSNRSAMVSRPVRCLLLEPKYRSWLQDETGSGWWYTYPSEKYDIVRLDHHPNENGENKIHVPVTTNRMIKFWVSPTFQSPDVHLISATSAPRNPHGSGPTDQNRPKSAAPLSFRVQDLMAQGSPHFP